MRLRNWFTLLVVVLAVAAAIFSLFTFNLSALNEPGRTETYLATLGKRWIVSRRARGPLPPEPPNDATGQATGGMIYRGECAQCHGLDGRKPSDIGRWMYPRTLDLASLEVQQWSDRELFWIIKNGIRLSGMPGFGKIHSDEQIWHLAHYIRSLSAQPKQ